MAPGYIVLFYLAKRPQCEECHILRFHDIHGPKWFLVTCMAPHPPNLYGLVTSMAPNLFKVTWVGDIHWYDKLCIDFLRQCVITLCYAIVLPSRKSAFRAGFRPVCYWEITVIGPLAGRRPAGGPISVFSRQQSGQNLARKADLRPGST